MPMASRILVLTLSLALLAGTAHAQTQPAVPASGLGAAGAINKGTGTPIGMGAALPVPVAKGPAECKAWVIDPYKGMQVLDERAKKRKALLAQLHGDLDKNLKKVKEKPAKEDYAELKRKELMLRELDREAKCDALNRDALVKASDPRNGDPHLKGKGVPPGAAEGQAAAGGDAAAQAQAVMQQQQEILRDIMQKLQAIQNANAEANRGVVRNM